MGRGMGLVDVLAVFLAWPFLLYAYSLRPWRRSNWGRPMSPAVDLLLVFALATGVIALYYPMPIAWLASRTVEQTSLPSQLESLDDEIHELRTLPERTWETMIDRLGLGDEEASDVEIARAPGPVATTVIPAVDEVVTMVLRTVSYGWSLIAAWFALILRLWFRRVSRRRETGAMERLALEDRVRKLEAALEERGSLPLDPGPDR